MLEAVTTDLVSPSAWSAAPKIFGYPQAAGRLPHLLGGYRWQRQCRRRKGQSKGNSNQP